MSLAWAWRRRHGPAGVRARTPRRLVWILPTRVLVEQTAAAIRHAFQNAGEDIPVHLLYGGGDPAADPHPPYGASTVHGAWLLHPEADQVLVGTEDMILSAALNRAYATRRYSWPVVFALLHNDALWILDETQLLGNGLRTARQLDALHAIESTFGPTQVTYMSATLDTDALRTVDAPEPPHPILQLGDEDLADPRLRARLHAQKILRHAGGVKPVKGAPRPEDVARLALGAFDGLPDDGFVLVVCNTVARARAVHAAAEAERARRRAAAGAPSLYLLHSHFRPADRRRLMAEILADRRRKLVISTQVVEAGVDVSADVLITELAPWSSLVQRMGRVNRYGARPGRVYWLDLDSQRAAAPYSAEELKAAKERLAALEGENVSPWRLQAVAPPPTRPEALPTLRRRDLHGLFDTSPNLSGENEDVGPFIRSADQLDVLVAWVEGGLPDRPRFRGEDLCSVPVYELRAAMAARPSALRAHRWDPIDGWLPVDGSGLRPGMLVALPSAFGAYSDGLGWNPDRREPAPPTPLAGAAADEDIDDDDATFAGRWISLEEHTDHVVTELAGLLGALGDVVEADAFLPPLLEAARYHDIGKTHPAFQERLGAAAQDGETPGGTRPASFWAKAPAGRGGGGGGRRPFRHELASALAYLQRMAPAGGHEAADELTALAAYVIAAHHGRVRLAIRSADRESPPPGGERRFALGVWEGDIVHWPGGGEIALSLERMELGGAPLSWSEMALGLLRRLGPFRLAYLEALLRIADWRASAREAAGDGAGRGPHAKEVSA
ncbi:MAG: CRISPR-associated endonuclease Cas3'' [Firmicutes bacterium]|nr:CRISPR-associated endonuclease Cas3'' [Bacillota bacterium]